MLQLEQRAAGHVNDVIAWNASRCYRSDGGRPTLSHHQVTAEIDHRCIGEEEIMSDYDNTTSSNRAGCAKNRNEYENIDVKGILHLNSSTLEEDRSFFENSSPLTSRKSSQLHSASSVQHGCQAQVKQNDQTIGKILHTQQRIRRMLQTPPGDAKEQYFTGSNFSFTDKRKKSRFSKKQYSMTLGSFRSRRRGVREDSENRISGESGEERFASISPGYSPAYRSTTEWESPSDSRSSMNSSFESKCSNKEKSNQHDYVDDINRSAKKRWTLGRGRSNKSKTLDRNQNLSLRNPSGKEKRGDDLDDLFHRSTFSMRKSRETDNGRCTTPQPNEDPFESLQSLPSPPPLRRFVEEPSDHQRSFSLIRAKSKRSSSKSKNLFRKSLPLHVHLDAIGNSINPVSSVQTSSPHLKQRILSPASVTPIEGEKSEAFVESMVMNAIHSKNDHFQMGENKSRTPHFSRSQKSRSLKNRILSAFARSEEKTHLPPTPEVGLTEKGRSHSSPHLSVLAIDKKRH